MILKTRVDRTGYSPVLRRLDAWERQTSWLSLVLALAALIFWQTWWLNLIAGVSFLLDFVWGVWLFGADWYHARHGGLRYK